jgi:hypothetical protein
VQRDRHGTNLVLHRCNGVAVRCFSHELFRRGIGGGGVAGELGGQREGLAPRIRDDSGDQSQLQGLSGANGAAGEEELQRDVRTDQPG